MSTVYCFRKYRVHRVSKLLMTGRFEILGLYRLDYKNCENSLMYKGRQKKNETKILKHRWASL